MGFRLSGDFGKLDRLISKLDDPGRVLDSVSKSMAEEAIDLVKEGYRTETDPYGKAWTPKLANDGRKTLSGKTSRLKTGWERERADREGFEIAASVGYAIVHQRPKKRKFRKDGASLTRRQIPEESKGMPANWEDDLLEAGLEAIEAAYRG